MHYVGKLDKTIYKRITDNLTTDDVIITDERIQHIKKRRGAEFLDKYKEYFSIILSDPDYIFHDNRPNTVIVCKTIEKDECAINIILRLAVEGENPAYKNSVLTAIRENKRRFEQRLRNNRPIYKKA